VGVCSGARRRPLLRQPPPQRHALAFLLSGTAALSAYLFAVIIDPERF